MKDYLATRLKVPPHAIYHACVMPCYDKKLEAARVDFERNGVRDVDCVITTAEVEAILQEQVLGLRLGRGWRWVAHAASTGSGPAHSTVCCLGHCRG